jgi:hypothetical protein
MRSRISHVAAVVAMLVGVLSCSSSAASEHDQHAQTVRTQATISRQAPAGDDPTVQISGGVIAGTLYVLAGPNVVKEDLYKVSGTFSDAQRITYSAEAGFDDIFGAYGHVILTDGRDVSGRIRLLLTDTNPIQLGPILETYGYSPSLGPGNRFSYAAHVNSEDTVFEATLGHPGSRAVLRSHSTAESSAWSPNGQLAVIVGLGRSAKVVLGVGTSHARMISPYLPGLIDMVGGGPNGLMALQGSGAIGLLQWNGRLRTVDTTWEPDCFSPNGSSLLVTSRDRSRLGVMSLKTGSITPVAHVRGGVFLVAAWTAPPA